MKTTGFYLILAFMMLVAAALVISESRQRKPVKPVEVKQPVVQAPAIIPQVKPESNIQKPGGAALRKAKKHRVKYRVKRGDCLWKIAKMKKHYGRGSMWVKIWRLNKKIIKNFNRIFPKQVLIIK